MKLFKALGAALGFLTILPIPDIRYETKDLIRSTVFYSLVGIILGLCLWGEYILLNNFFSDLLIIIIMITTVALVSGGLHWDGLADSFDALGGGRGDSERMLRIMKDPAVGAHGVLALIIGFALQAIGLYSLFPLKDKSIVFPFILLLFPAVGRWAAVLLMILFPYARKDGLGAPYHKQIGVVHFIGAGIWVAVVLVMVLPVLIWSVVAAMFFAVLWGWFFNRRLGGLTGDVYGAGVIVAEIAFLLACNLEFSVMLNQ